MKTSTSFLNTWAATPELKRNRMLLLIESLIVVVLTLVLVTLYIDEHRTKNQNIPTAKVTGFWLGHERRRSRRIKAAIQIRYITGKKPYITGATLTKNISTGGILIETCEKLLVETVLVLEIDIPSHQKSVTANGKVVWGTESSNIDEEGRRTFHLGIKFVYMQPREKKLLDQYIDKISG